MEIYIEIFLIQNILINFCLLKLVQVTTKSKTSWHKLILASIVGSVPSVIVVLILNNTSLLNITKFLTAFAMLFVAFKQTKKQFFFNTILLFLYTYALGGVVTSLSSSVYYTSFGAVMTSKFSLEAICLIIVVFTYLFELVTRHLKLKVKTNGLIYNLTLTHKNKTINTYAYLDTGNFLNLDGKPILVLDLDIFLKLTNTNLISFFTSNHSSLTTQTVNGKNDLQICNIEQIEISQGKNKIKFNNQSVAINTNNCFKNTNYKALISPLFL